MSFPGGQKVQDVLQQDTTSELVNLYMIRADTTLTLTASPALDATTISVSDASAVVDGEALNFYEGVRFSQCIVQSHTANSVTFTPPIDFAYTTAAEVITGPWNMNVSGTPAAPAEFFVKPPPGASFDIYTLRFSMTDSVAMDSAKFGGITALANGVVVRFEDGFTKNLGVIVNNLGFREQGFVTQYDDKAPAGVYGFSGEANGPVTYGTAPRLSGDNPDMFMILVQDDLTGLDSINFTVGGHVVTP